MKFFLKIPLIQHKTIVSLAVSKDFTGVKSRKKGVKKSLQQSNRLTVNLNTDLDLWWSGHDASTKKFIKITSPALTYSALDMWKDAKKLKFKVCWVKWVVFNWNLVCCFTFNTFTIVKMKGPNKLHKFNLFMYSPLATIHLINCIFISEYNQTYQTYRLVICVYILLCVIKFLWVYLKVNYSLLS